MTAQALQPALAPTNHDGLRPLGAIDVGWASPTAPGTRWAMPTLQAGQDEWLTGMDAISAKERTRAKEKFELPPAAKLRPLSALENTPGIRTGGDLHPLDFAQDAFTARANGAKSPPKPLDESDSRPGVRPALDEHARLEKQTQRLIAQTFIGPVLKQMHNSPFKSSLWEGGRGGQAFSELYDQHLVDRVGRVAGRKLVAGIVRKFEAKKAYPAKRGGASPGSTDLNQSKMPPRNT